MSRSSNRRSAWRSDWAICLGDLTGDLTGRSDRALSGYTLAMSVQARRCQGCGSPLPEAPANARTITCEFCGVVHDVSASGVRPQVAPAGRPAVTPAVRPAVRPAAKGSFFAVFSIFAAVAVTTAVIVWSWHRMLPMLGAIDDMNRNAGRTPVPTATLAMRDLPTLAEPTYRALITPAPPTGWTGFDPVVGVTWASEIARAWAPDARLTRIDLGLIASDGSADLTADREETVGYRFSSPSRIAQWSRIADREADATVPFELLIRVAGKQVAVYVHNGRPPSEALPPPLDSLPLRDVLTHAHQSGRFPDRPFYTGFLIHETRIGWVWTFQSLSGRDNVPIVRAHDAAVYPWP